MRILTTTLCYPTPEHPDQGVFVQRRAHALAGRPLDGAVEPHPGVDVQVVSPLPWCPLLRRTRPIADLRHPLPVCYPRMLSVPVLNWATDGLAYACAIKRVIRRMHRLGQFIDLIDAHFEYPDGVGAWLTGRQLGIPVVVTVRGKIVSLSRRAIRRLQIRAMLRGVDARIAVSDSLANWVRRLGGSDLHVHVIPNGVDPAVFHLVARERARSILGWQPNARYLLAVGHLQRLKGFDRLVSVLPRVRADAGHVRLVLVGSQRGERSFRRGLERSIAECNAAEPGARAPCVQFLGPVDSGQLNLMYNAADVLVSASRSEGWSNVISESLAAGTPVVATDVGGNAEQICSPQLGILVPDGDPDALVRGITAALFREWSRAFISAHGGARSWRHVAEEVHAVFTRVVSVPKKHRSSGFAAQVPAATIMEGSL